MKRLLSGLFLLCAVLLAAQSSVMAAGERINAFDSEITLDAQNRAHIIERITYDFGSESRHGIYRTVPTVYETGDGMGYRVDIEVNEVTRDGQKEPYETIRHGESIELKIGDADRTVTGSHEYAIDYSLKPAALAVDGADIFRFDVVGQGWEIPVTGVSATVRSDMPIRSAACYTGEFGSGDDDCSATVRDGTATYTARAESGTGRGFTIEAAYPSDTFATYPEIRPVSELHDRTPLYIFGGVMAALTGLFGFICYKYARYRWRRKQELVVPQYEPPAHMTPAEIGFLFDNVSSTNEITATLIDAARRGYIKIERQEGKGLFKKTKYQLVKRREFTDLEDYEKVLLEALFDDKPSVYVDKIDRSKAQRAVASMRKKLERRLTDKGYYRQKGFGLTALFARVSESGYDRWAEVEGFRQFLSLTEKERMDFHEAPERNPENFSELLPYAIALGVEEKWAEQFEGIDVAPATEGWYAGGNAHNAVLLSGAFSDFGSSVASQVQVSNSVSTGGAGGGFSGGGVGGGGGGSW